MGAIENQRIAKRGNNRRNTSTLRHNTKSASFNTGFMDHFSQNPAHNRKKTPVYMFTSNNRPTHTRRQERPVRGRKSRSSGFSFPIPSVATLAVIAGTVLLSLAALKWEDLNIQMPEKYAFQPSSDENTEQNTLLYAATGISNIMPSLQLPEKETSTITTANASTATTQAATPTAIAPEKQEKPASTKPAEVPEEKLVTFEWQKYKVKKGDSVSGIAKKFGVSVGAIIASNEIRNARALKEGAVLRVPNIDGIPYTVKKGDNLSKISASFNVPLDVILDINDIKSDIIKTGETLFIPGARMNDMDLRMSLGELFIYPSHNKFITSKFGMRKDPISGALNFHTGIDLRGNTGATVMAAMDGTVSVVSENWLYGKHIIISHSNGFKTLYGHLDSSSVKQGDRVIQGKKIGEIGNTGYSTGSHLHFSIYDKNNKLVNPLDLLK